MEHSFTLIIKYLSGHSLSPEEKKLLLDWQALSSENASIFSEIKKLRLLTEYNRYNTDEQKEMAFSSLQARISHQSRTVRLRNLLKYAVSILLVISLSMFGWEFFNTIKYTTIATTPNETVKKVQLIDGSTVWLSGTSELRIPKSYSSTHREVLLKGKAFFDIHKDSISPFLVASRYTQIKVMGTSFDLTMNNDGKDVETILVSGKVMIQNSRKQNIFEVTPGEKVIYNAEQNKYTVELVDANTLTAWHLDQITFDNTTLREIVNKLSLIYDVNINLESKQIANRRFRCVINREESLKEVLDILSYLAPIKYRIEEDEVFITE